MAAVETFELTKRFGDDVLAVDGLDLSIESGEIYGFLGPNGAGKSTTINMLLDLVRPSDGRAEVLGMDCQAESEAIRERIGVLPEGFDLYGRLTGRSHLEFAIRAKDVDDDPDRVLDRVGLDREDGDRDVSGYSKGMRQRLALGMALVGDPDLLILDEPSSGLDPTGIAEVQEIVAAEADSGTAVFFSSHILGEVEAVCDRVGILDHGELIAEGTIAELHGEFAGDGRLHLTVDDLSDGALEAVTAIDGVVDVAHSGHSVTVVTERPRAKAQAITTFEHQGVAVQDVDTEEDSLSDVFAKLTGGSHDSGETDA